MPPNGVPSVSLSRRGPKRLGGEPLRTVVWVGGEQDMATRVQLTAGLAEAAGLDDADVVVDISGVTFMDASTIGALVVARNGLRAHSRSLSVRDPSPSARGLLNLCGLARLIDQPSAPVGVPVVTALGSWVGVPARDSGKEPALPPVAEEPPALEPALATARVVEPAESIQGRRAPP